MCAKIAVVTMGVKLGYETKGYTRFLSVAQTLHAAGHEVDLITSSFQHWEKRQRDLDVFPYDIYPFGIKFVYEPGYAKNIDLKRMKSHRIAAKNLSRLLDQNGFYDLIYCEIPPNDVAFAAAKLAENNNIPFVGDINDLWPEAMRMVLDVPIISDILFHGLAKDASEVYKRLSGVVGTSDEYAKRPYTDCDKSIEHITVYVGNDIDLFDESVKKYSDEIVKPEGEIWIIYTGTIGRSYDLETLIKASAKLNEINHRHIRIKILGDGPDMQRLQEIANSLECNVDFLGYQPYEKMAAWLAKSDITINSLVAKAPQSIVTKIADYLASGHPMINTGSSLEFRDKVIDDGFGTNVAAEDHHALVDAILALINNPDMMTKMGQNARKVALEQFDRKTSYQAITKLVNKLLNK